MGKGNDINMKDVIYKDKQYTVIKKYADDLGVFTPMVCVDLIDIATKQLKEWENGGFASVMDYRDIINKLCENLRDTITY